MLKASDAFEDVFLIPFDWRINAGRMVVRSQCWIESNAPGPSFRRNTKRGLWGTLRGRWKLRVPSPGARVMERRFRAAWRGDGPCAKAVGISSFAWPRSGYGMGGRSKTGLGLYMRLRPASRASSCMRGGGRARAPRTGVASRCAHAGMTRRRGYSKATRPASSTPSTPPPSSFFNKISSTRLIKNLPAMAGALLTGL